MQNWGQSQGKVDEWQMAEAEAKLEGRMMNAEERVKPGDIEELPGASFVLPQPPRHSHACSTVPPLCATRAIAARSALFLSPLFSLNLALAGRSAAAVCVSRSCQLGQAAGCVAA